MTQPLADILPQLRIGNQTALIDFYQQNRTHFARWAQQRQDLTAPQAYQRLRNALLLFYDQVVDGRLTMAPADVQDYLYHLALQEPAAETETAHELPVAEAGRRRRLVLFFRHLSADSQRVLTYFYFRGYNFVKVAGKMGYPNAAVARQQKLSSLRALADWHQRSRGATPA